MPRSAAAARQRRLRARQRAGEVVAPVVVSNDVVAALMDLGWLRECESEDRKQIGNAVAAMLKDLADATKP